MDYERTLEACLVIRRLCHPVTCPDPTPAISESWPGGCRQSRAHLELAAAHASWDAGSQRSPASPGLKFSSDKDQLFALVLWEKWMSVAACHRRAKNDESMFLTAPRWRKFRGTVAVAKVGSAEEEKRSYDGSLQASVFACLVCRRMTGFLPPVFCSQSWY